MRQVYRVPSRSLVVRPGVNLEKALRLAAQVEDDEFVRKLELRAGSEAFRT